MELLNSRRFDPVRGATVTDEVFGALYDDVVTLALPPGAKLSEAEVARRFGVSRQPVRDAFYRLSQLGFLVVRPQRATTVSPISEAAVLQARFIRTAIEVETTRVACAALTGADHAELAGLLDAQTAAVAAADRVGFHRLDDAFHRRICEMAGLAFAWRLIRDTKAQMDRVRFLSLDVGAERALAEHRAILAALTTRDADGTVARVREHLSRIEDILRRLHASHQAYFGPA